MEESRIHDPDTKIAIINTSIYLIGNPEAATYTAMMKLYLAFFVIFLSAFTLAEESDCPDTCSEASNCEKCADGRFWCRVEFPPGHLTCTNNCGGVECESDPDCCETYEYCRKAHPSDKYGNCLDS